MKPTTALTSSLRHAALRKSGSSSTVIALPFIAAARRVAAASAGSTSRGALSTRTQPPGRVSAAIQIAAGTTADSGQ